MHERGCCWSGRLQAALEVGTDHVRSVLAGSEDLQSAARSADRAFQLYRKTRPAPSPESIKRARSGDPEGIHPLLARALPETGLGAQRRRARLTANAGCPVRVSIGCRPVDPVHEFLT